MTADGKVLTESDHPIEKSQVPKAVLDSYKKWNPRGVEGMGPRWSVESKKAENRVYHVEMDLNAVTRYKASFKEDGSIVAVKPARVP